MENIIDLQNFVGKKVKVRYKNGQTKEGVISEDSDFKDLYNYYFNGVAYTRCGSTHGVLARGGFRIVNIESMEFEDNYKQLVAEVSALRVEVEILKAERSVRAEVPASNKPPDLKPMKVSRSIVIQPEEYLEYCECYREDPSRKGYIDFVKMGNDHMFSEGGTYQETIEEVEE